MKLGIVGLPNVGKSTLFNSLTKAGAESANYPFCTIDPNVGIVTVPDARVDYLAEKYHSKKVIPAAIEFVDIAGLVKGASKGEGLGNQFLANIREVDAIVHVVRCFDDGNIVHVDGSVNPLRDIETINFELIFSDIEVLDRRIAKSTKGSRNDKSLAHEVEFLSKVKAHLEDGKLAKTFEVDDEEDQEPGKFEKLLVKLFGEKAEKVVMGCTVAFSVIMAVAIFMVLPYYISGIFRNFIVSNTLLAVLEGVIRLGLFTLYVVLISCMKDIKRTYMYHGAEHKCINCIERGRELNVKNVRKSSRYHARCGTSFLFIVMVISIVFFIFIRVDSPILRVVFRILLVPVIAGVSYEFIRLAGRSDNPLMKVLSLPGKAMQKLTTREPDDDMIEVAIAAVEAVFDWKAFLGYPVEEEQNVEIPDLDSDTENVEVPSLDSVLSGGAEEMED